MASYSFKRLSTYAVQAARVLVIGIVLFGGVATAFAQEAHAPHLPPCHEGETNPGTGWCYPADENGDVDQEASRNELLEAVTDPAKAIGEGALSVVLSAFVGLSYIVLAFSNFLLFLAGAFFNWIMVETVLEFGLNFGNSPGVLAGWSVLRDLGNIALLFSFVFIGLATILGLQSYTVTKTLPRLIIFAVLLNFSLFVAEAVIDVTNGLSATIASQATTQQNNCASATRTVDGDNNIESEQQDCATDKNYGISGSIMNASGLASSFRPPIEECPLLNLNCSMKNISMMLGLTLFSSILAVVLIAAGIMFVIRVVTLLLIMVTAPIGFAGMVVPFLKGIAEKWWGALLHQSLFAPVFLLLVFIGLTILNHSPFAAASQAHSIGDALGSGDMDTISILVTFTLVVGFLLAALIIARRLGAVGADFAIKTAGGLVYGTMGGAARITLGRGSHVLAGAVRRSGFGDNEVGRMFTKVLDKGASSSYDFRAGTASAFGKLGVDMGRTTRGGAGHGVTGVLHERVESRLAFKKSVGDERTLQLEQLERKEGRLEDQKEKLEVKAAQSDGRVKERFEKAAQKKEREVEETKDKIANLPLKRAKDLAAELKGAKGESDANQRALVDAVRQVARSEAALKVAEAGGDAKASAAAEAQLNAAKSLRDAAEVAARTSGEQVERFSKALSGIQNSYADHLEELADKFPLFRREENLRSSLEMREIDGRDDTQKALYKILDGMKGISKGGSDHSTSHIPKAGSAFGSGGGGGVKPAGGGGH